MKIGELLKTSREKKLLTRKELAKLIGVCYRTILNIEIRGFVPTITIIKKISNFFNEDPAWSEMIEDIHKSKDVQNPFRDIRAILCGAVSSKKKAIYLDEIIWLIETQNRIGFIISADTAKSLFEDNFCSDTESNQ